MNELFSPTEQKVLKILNRHRRVLKIAEVSDKVYKGKKKPFNHQNNVAGVVIRINKKCHYHKLTWFINSYGMGRTGKFVWKDKRS